jgi:hypothetical protein
MVIAGGRGHSEQRSVTNEHKFRKLWLIMLHETYAMLGVAFDGLEHYCYQECVKPLSESKLGWRSCIVHRPRPQNGG